MARIGFVLSSCEQAPLPSTRIAALNMFPYLRAAGFAPEVLFAPSEPSERLAATLEPAAIAARGHRIVCFQKVHGEAAVALASRLSEHGLPTVFMVCDVVDAAMAEATDATVVVTEHLASLYPSSVQHKVHVVHDGIERPGIVKQAWRDDRGSPGRPLVAVLVGSTYLTRLPLIGLPPDWLVVETVGPYPRGQGRLRQLRDMQWRIRAEKRWAGRWEATRFLLHPRVTRSAWHEDAVYDSLVRADIGIIPVDPGAESAGDRPPAWSLKSENRLTLKMSVGLPVIASPVPSYEPIVVQGENGFIARSRADWLECLERLRDPTLRRRIGTTARASVHDRFSKDKQARRLVRVFSSLLGREPRPHRVAA